MNNVKLLSRRQNYLPHHSLVASSVYILELPHCQDKNPFSSFFFFFNILKTGPARFGLRPKKAGPNRPGFKKALKCRPEPGFKLG